MANRAYLYSMPSECAWWECADERDYFDSRWNIPICWWFFFDLQSLRLVDQHDGEWQEIRLVKPKAEAIATFQRRTDVISDLIQDRLLSAHLRYFIDVIRCWPDDFLALEPDEILGGYSLPDEENIARFKTILANLSDSSLPVDTIQSAVQCYSPIGDDSKRWELQILGHTYGALANAKRAEHCDERN